jgi:hypothetical protein
LSEEDIQKSIDKLLKPIIDLEGISIPGICWNNSSQL